MFIPERREPNLLDSEKGLLTESIVISHSTKYTIPNEVFECACKLS